MRPSRAAVAVAATLTATGVFVPFTPPAQAALKRHVIVVAPAGTTNASDRGPGTFAGTYRLNEPLRFDAADSGRGGHTVTWRASGGATILSGAQPVTGWALDDAATGIYKAHVGTGFDARQLYVDGALAQRARIRLARTDITLNLIATSHAAGVTGQFSFTDFAVTP
ncbi:hypothetical protein [Phytohabitans rumicis]|uniref:Uncharacterized protein n=1 Tax=Phytohabitans rumicis TaxID=1076125 RepID=A0A6V8L0U6_9ACTN|nr:hypothetical protein [Phytohabitans rumicis]GFJ87727.1 hypothetical protein Prum_013690 [Phytohabitans rumicis]